MPAKATWTGQPSEPFLPPDGSVTPRDVMMAEAELLDRAAERLRSEAKAHGWPIEHNNWIDAGFLECAASNVRRGLPLSDNERQVVNDYLGSEAERPR